MQFFFANSTIQFNFRRIDWHSIYSTISLFDTSFRTRSSFFFFLLLSSIKFISFVFSLHKLRSKIQCLMTCRSLINKFEKERYPKAAQKKNPLHSKLIKCNRYILSTYMSTSSYRITNNNLRVYRVCGTWLCTTTPVLQQQNHFIFLSLSTSFVVCLIGYWIYTYFA